MTTLTGLTVKSQLPFFKALNIPSSSFIIRKRSKMFSMILPIEATFSFWTRLRNIGASALFLGMATQIFLISVAVHAEDVDRPEKRQLTVKDVIEMRHIIDPFPGASLYKPPVFKFSPDRDHFILVTQRGNLETGNNDAEILLYRVDEVLQFLNDTQEKSLPRAHVLARFSSSSNLSAVRQLRWMPDNNSLAFIGEPPNKPGQVFHLNISSGELKQLTNHPRSILYFSLDDSAENIVFASTVVSFNKNWARPSFVVGTLTLSQIMSRDQPFPEHIATELQFYSTQSHSKDGAQPLMKPYLMGSGVNEFLPYDIWISPDGRRVALLVPATHDRELHWIGSYQPLSNSVTYKNLGDSFDENTMPKTGTLFRQFAIVNLANGEVEKVIDAPIGTNIGGLHAKALWHPNSEAIFLANTFMPLEGVGAEERARRIQAPAIALYDLDTSKFTRLTEIRIQDDFSEESPQFAEIEFAANADLVTSWTRKDGSGLPDKLFREFETGWLEVQTKDTQLAKNNTEENRLKLSTREDLNTSPNVLASDALTGNSKVITDLNPQFEDLAFGRAEPFNWNGPEDRKLIGGLIYPAHYNPEKRYPLVIQTRGFYPGRFLLAGPLTGITTSTYAAQALANRGIMVLQVPDLGTNEREKEISLQSVSIEAAIQKLDRLDLVDTGKIGLVGFSRSGFYVQDLITFSKYYFAAAVVADASNLSQFSLSVFFGRPFGMRHIEDLVGAQPWGYGLERWINKDPNLRLDYVKTALRVENYGPEISPWWATYSMLRRLNKPVDFIMYPKGKHNLGRPFEQLASQQGTVDWFAFWLKGEEDPDPEKKEQYNRWRMMLPQQERSIETAGVARRTARQ